jgi:hypothetical protein
MNVTILISTAIFWLLSLQAPVQKNNPATGRPDGKIEPSAGQPETATVFTYSRRPLLETIELLNDEYGWNIHYEDAPTLDPSEVVDDDAEFRKAHPGYQRGYEPKGEPFHSVFEAGDTSPVGEEAILQQVLRDYGETTNPGRYALERTTQNGFAIVGSEYHSPSGASVEFEPPLSCKISLRIPPMSLHDALEAVVAELKGTCKSNRNIEYAAGGEGDLQKMSVSGTYNQEAARNVVEDLISQEPGLFYYMVEYKPVVNQFYLEIQLTLRTIRNGDGSQHVEPALNQRIGSPQ